MKIAIDYDGTLVKQEKAYTDLSTPEFQPHAVEALKALKAAGHFLILYSARSNLYLRNKGRHAELNEKRYRAMVADVNRRLPGIFDKIDDGSEGKVTADLFIDDKAIRFGRGANAMDWWEIGETFGDLPEDLGTDTNGE